MSNTVAELLQGIVNSKNDMITAFESNGITIPADSKLSSFSEYINQLVSSTIQVNRDGDTDTYNFNKTIAEISTINNNYFNLPVNSILSCSDGTVTITVDGPIVEQTDYSYLFTVNSDGVLVGYSGTDIANVVVPDTLGITRISASTEVFQNHDEITQILIPVGIEVDAGAFDGCDNLPTDDDDVVYTN